MLWGWARNGVLSSTMDEFVTDVFERRNVITEVYDDILSFNKFAESSEGCINKNRVFMLHLNVRSYNKHIDELIVILDSIKVKFDVVILTETWMSASSMIVELDGYDVFFNQISRNQNDGVVAYVNKSFSCVSVDVSLYGATGIKLDFACGGERVCLLAVYRSPRGGNDLELFISDLQSYCDSRAGGRTHWIIGDTNCCILPGNDDPRSQLYLDVLYEAGFVSCINVPTRETFNSSSCLDHIFVDALDTSNIRSCTIKSEMTDHFFTVSAFELPSNKPQFIVKNREFSYIDEQLCQELIRSQNWDSVLLNNNSNESCNIFVNLMKEIVSSSTKTKHVSAKCTKLKPWITSNLLKSIRHRDKLSKQVKRQPFNRELSNNFKNYRNTLSNLIKNAKEIYFRSQIEKSKDNSKLLWKNIGTVMGVKKNKEGFPIEVFANGNDRVGSDEVSAVADAFNEYFVNVGASLASAVPPVAEPVVDDEAHRTDSVFQLRPVTEEELAIHVRELRSSSAPGVDNIPPLIIKNNFDLLKAPLLHLINRSIVSGIYPSSFKLGKVIPIFKGGQKDQMCNFRPITLSNALAKLLEKCVRRQLENYLYEFNLLFNRQFGFRTDKNANDALFSLTSEIHNLISSNKKVILVFIDLAKAFDTVDRELLIRKLKFIGVQDNSVKWFKSYFEDRHQVVSILNKYSDKKNIEYGVIQGSTLGPLLFLIYMNNLGKVNINSGQAFLYADDTALLFHGDSWEEVYGAAEHGLLTVKRWFDQNRLTLNLKKTKQISISLRADGDPPDIQQLRLHTCGTPRECVTCERVDRVTEYQYLGIWFDQRMRWTSHVQFVRSKLRKFIYIFSNLNRVLSPDLLKTVYYAYVQSVLQYGILVWGGALKTTLTPLSILQKAIIKVALKKDRRFPTDQLFDEFKVFNITQLFVKSLILFMFKNRLDIFQQTTHNYRTRSAVNTGIIIPRVSKAFNLTNPFYIASVLFSKLPHQIKSPNQYSFLAFKKRVVAWMSQVGRSNIDYYISPTYYQ